jgi:hypothetical protein
LQTCRKISQVTPSIRAKIDDAAKLVEGKQEADKTAGTIVKASNDIMSDFAAEYAKNYHIVVDSLGLH